MLKFVVTLAFLSKIVTSFASAVLKARRTLVESWLCQFLVCEQTKAATQKD